MKYIISYLILFISLSTGVAKSQTAENNTEQLLGTLFNRLVDNYNDGSRIRINDSIRTIIDSYVNSDSVFNHRFSDLRYLGQITSPDSLVKIVTWNLVLEDAPGKYFCYLIKKGEPGKKNIVCRMSADYNNKPVIADTSYSVNDWYGALYYDIRPVPSGNSRCWVMLGIDYGNAIISRKIIEVLNFNDDGSVILGRKWFDNGKEKVYRAVFEYASSAMMSLRFKNENSIVFDHLVPFKESQKGDLQYYGPDYSFDAYNYQNGIWKLVINVDVRNQE
jgi:hypothetical protein